MAIQFYCPGCAQPIEVDDELAGRPAGCPYCRRVVTVPTASTFTPDAPPAARPATAPTAPPSGLGVLGPGSAPPGSNFPPDAGFDPRRIPPPPPYGLPGGYGPPAVAAEELARRRRARLFGNAALICLGLTAACMAASMIVVLSHAPLPLIPPGADPQPIMAEWQKELAEKMEKSPTGMISLGLLGPAMMIFPILSFISAIISLVISRATEWRGWVAMGCLLLTFCCIASGAATVMGRPGG